MKRTKKRLTIGADTLRHLTGSDLRLAIGGEGSDPTQAGKSQCVDGCTGGATCAVPSHFGTCWTECYSFPDTCDGRCYA